MKLKWIFLFFLLPVWISVFASTTEIDNQAKQIANQLRCPVCRGVPISESPSTLAIDMMSVIRQKLETGQTEEAIIAYFENRYGEWILLKPKPEGLNLMIWILPLMVFLGGGAILLFAVKKWSASN